MAGIFMIIFSYMVDVVMWTNISRQKCGPILFLKDFL